MKKISLSQGKKKTHYLEEKKNKFVILARKINKNVLK
jgi:hypothetical protein